MLPATGVSVRTALSLGDSGALGLSNTSKTLLRCLYATPTSSRTSRSTSRRTFTTSPQHTAPNNSILGISSNQSSPSSYFQRPSLPANTVIRFVPQQTAWIVERMGKFNRILQPGLAILIPFLDRIAYVRSLKEAAIEIPSQSAITADNVTLELDGVLYTRVFDAYKARCVQQKYILDLQGLIRYVVTASKMQSMPFLNSHKQPCARRSAS